MRTSTFVFICVLLASIMGVGIYYKLNTKIEQRNKDPKERTEIYSVQLLFENEGCKVYRFEDPDNYSSGGMHYYVNCPNGSKSTQYNRYVPSGKIQILKQEYIPTDR